MPSHRPPSRHSPLLFVLSVIAAAVASSLTPAVAETKAAPAVAEQPAPPAEAAKPAAGDVKKIPILLVRQKRERALPLSLLEIPPADEGLGGAKLAVADNNTTGKFLKQEFTLDVIEDSDPEKLTAETVKRVDGGIPYVMTDVDPAVLLKIADALKGKEAIVFDAGTSDESVREEQCRANVLHTAPSRTMLADALAQYLVWKRWGKWLLVVGQQPDDKALADAIRRSAKRFGAKIVEEREFKYDPGSRRADGGYEQIQQQIPTFTQNAPAYDVLIVADEGRQFGDDFPYRTWDARPVAGTAGLYPASWHPAIELWGATQFQNRFKQLTGREMRPLDYNVWMAIRSIGEAATRRQSGLAKDIIPYFKSPEFELAAFKGQKLTYRTWNGQLRQPVLVATAAILVSVSPQPGFLHQLTELDTLGVDRPETRCKLGPG